MEEALDRGLMITSDGPIANVIQVGCDEQLVSRLCAAIRADELVRFASLSDVDTALAYLAMHRPPMVILCIGDRCTKSEAIRLLRSAQPTKSPIIVIYDELAAEDVLQLMRAGALECLARPVNLSRFSLVFSMITASARGTPRQLSQPPVAPTENRNAARLGRADAAVTTADLGLDQQLVQQLHAVAPLDTTISITGETGTGKTRLSRFIHAISPRRDRRFLAVNCGALSETLLESELFGHVRGAFTGADRDHVGKFSQCSDGTLLLDEVDTLSLKAQVKLLQVIEDRVFYPVGSEEPHSLEARLIVASNKSLEQEVAENRFRSDFYYRLNVMAFQLLPLRDRAHEIRRLVCEFAVEFANHHQLAAPLVTESALVALESFGWPGNVRELRNTMERAVILSGGSPIEVNHLPQHVVESIDPSVIPAAPVESGLVASHATAINPSSNKLANARVAAEREQLLQALERNDNNRSKTALDLGISRVALYKRLRKFSIL